jgi:hypothetical protein
MAHIGIIIRLCTRETDVLHDLVLTFTGDLVPGEDDLDVTPVGVLGDLLVDKVA